MIPTKSFSDDVRGLIAAAMVLALLGVAPARAGLLEDATAGTSLTVRHADTDAAAPAADDDARYVLTDVRVLSGSNVRPLLVAPRLELRREAGSLVLAAVDAVVDLGDFDDREELERWLSARAGEGADPLKLELRGATVRVNAMELGPLDAVIEARSGKVVVSARGVAIGERSELELDLEVTPGAGPDGSHLVSGNAALAGVSVAEVRRQIPTRMNPAFSGTLDLSARIGGVWGDENTMERPAEPLVVDFRTSLPLTILGRTEKLEAAAQGRFDGQRVVLRDGSLTWADWRTGLTGWVGASVGARFALRAAFAAVDAAKVAADLGVAEAWRPRATVDGVLTLEGTPEKSFLRYEAKAPVVDLFGMQGLPIHVENVQSKGGLLEINAEAMMSFSCDSLSLGDIDLPSLPGGIRWFGGKLGVRSSGVPLWGGENSFSSSWQPAAPDEFLFGGQVENVDAEPFFAEILAGYGVALPGKVHAIYRYDDRNGPVRHLYGRAGVTDSAWPGWNPLRAVLAEVLAVGDQPVALSSLERAHVKSLDDSKAWLRRVSFDFQRRPSGIELRGLVADLGDARMFASIDVGADHSLSGVGAVVLSASLTADLVAGSQWLAALVDASGRLALEVDVAGSTGTPVVAISAGARALLEQAAAGAAVEPWTALPGSGLEFDMPAIPVLAVD